MPQPDYRRILLESILPWWESHGADDVYGGVLTCFDNEGRLLSTDKYTWSQGRWAWLAAEICELADDGIVPVDPRPWRRRAVETAGFLLDHAVRPDATTRFVTGREGRSARDAPDADDLSVLADLFAVLGMGAGLRAGLPESARALEAATRILGHVAEAAQAGSYASAPYPVPDGYDSMSTWMNLFHTASELLRARDAVPGRPEWGAVEQIRDAAAVRLAGPEGFLTGQHGPHRADWVDLKARDARHRGTLLNRHRTPGHMLELVWMMIHAERDGGPHLGRDHALGLAARALELGWDGDRGGLLRFTDVDGGPPVPIAPGGRRPAYEQLICDTWSTKLWWVHAEAMYTTALLADITGSESMAGWAGRIADYTLRTFPDPAGQEWIQIRSRNGAPLDEVVALPVKDPFHITRSLIHLIRLCHNHDLAQGKGTSNNASATA